MIVLLLETVQQQLAIPTGREGGLKKDQFDAANVYAQLQACIDPVKTCTGVIVERKHL